MVSTKFIESKSQNIIMIDSCFYDFVNSFGVLEERLFYFICNKYRMAYNNFVLGGHDENIKRQDENNNIIVFFISYNDFYQEIKHLKINTHIVTLLKMLPSKIIRTHENNDISTISLFNSIKYIDELKVFEISVTNEFLKVLKLKDFEGSKFFKIYYNEFKTITGKHTKKLYRLSSRYLNQEYYKMNINILKNYFLVPQSYRMTHIDRLLTSSIKELQEKTNFKVNYSKTKQNNKVKYFNFHFSEY